MLRLRGRQIKHDRLFCYGYFWTDTYTAEHCVKSVHSRPSSSRTCRARSSGVPVLCRVAAKCG